MKACIPRKPIEYTEMQEIFKLNKMVNKLPKLNYNYGHSSHFTNQETRSERMLMIFTTPIKFGDFMNTKKIM